MSRRMVMIIVLIVGIGIGTIVPLATDWWYKSNRASTALDSISKETALTKDALTKVTYHFGVEQDMLTVIEGTPGAEGRVIMTGLNVQAWPKEMLEMAPKVEFYSLDEVQSFIDTVNETIWLEKKAM